MAKKETNNKSIKKNTVWSTKRVDKWMKDYSEGIIHKDSPWLDGQIGVRNPNLVFEYTPEEIEELTKCAEDIIYFANNYCYCLHGTRGYQPLTLRDYQEEMLKAYHEHRFCCTLSSRQVGKCSLGCDIYINNKKCEKNKIKIEEFYDKNCLNHTFLQKIKNYLYKLYHKL